MNSKALTTRYLYFKKVYMKMQNIFKKYKNTKYSKLQIPYWDKKNANQPIETHVRGKWFLWWGWILLFQCLLFSVRNITYTAVFSSILGWLSTRQHHVSFCTTFTMLTDILWAVYRSEYSSNKPLKNMLHVQL